MEVSSTSMKVARVTVSAMAHGLLWGFHAAGAAIGRGRASAEEGAVIVAISVS